MSLELTNLSMFRFLILEQAGMNTVQPYGRFLHLFFPWLSETGTNLILSSQRHKNPIRSTLSPIGMSDVKKDYLFFSHLLYNQGWPSILFAAFHFRREF